MMFSVTDTIVAIATPPGRGGIGVVRLSGPAACDIVRGLITHDGALQPRHATLTRLRSHAETASFGVASTGPNGPDISLKVDALIRTADECLYRSKLEGRDRTSGSEIAVSRPLVARG